MNIFHKSLGHRLSTATEIILKNMRCQPARDHDLYLAKLTDINRNGFQITKTDKNIWI